MSDSEYINDEQLQASLNEMSIRGLLTEDEINEQGIFDDEEVTTALLDQMQDLVAPLDAVEASSWPQFAEKVDDIQKKIEGLANRGAIARFFSKGGKKAQKLVAGLTKLKVYANELGKRIKSDSGTTISRDIHGLADKTVPLKNALSQDQRRSLTAYINTLHNDYNTDGDLDAIGFKRKAAVDAFLELKAEDVDSLADVLAGIPLPAPSEIADAGEDSDGDGVPDLIDGPATGGEAGASPDAPLGDGGDSAAEDSEDEAPSGDEDDFWRIGDDEVPSGDEDESPAEEDSEELSREFPLPKLKFRKDSRENKSLAISRTEKLKKTIDDYADNLRDSSRSPAHMEKREELRLSIADMVNNLAGESVVSESVIARANELLSEAADDNSAQMLTEQVNDYRRWRTLAGMN